MKFDIVHMNYCGYDIIENNGEIRNRLKFDISLTK